ncbi:MAG: Cupin domain protein [Ignavibacteria bacterium]|nr:Cupin domain protein [Ignavibacteria bacterium]
MINNIFPDPKLKFSEEIFETLIQMPDFRLKKIISTGQATPEGTWYDQGENEWVILLKGAAVMRFEDEEYAKVLKPGDYILIPAHRKHRVESTSKDEATVWLALHY